MSVSFWFEGFFLFSIEVQKMFCKRKIIKMFISSMMSANLRTRYNKMLVSGSWFIGLFKKFIIGHLDLLEKSCWENPKNKLLTG